MSENTHRGTKI